ncbi:MAG: radical SAM protein [Candidatus Hodarchaeaceae archaeon]|nr:radical SAM protein [Candidatus Hodarchaeaceae archaeon]
MSVIRSFDPWGDPLCTCPKKYSFDPYTGCPHSCLYCYITSYVPRAFDCRPKENLIKRVERDLGKIDKRCAISMSNSSDPYPPMEAKLKLTRSCLELFARECCRVLVITKSDLVARDVDLLAQMSVAVSVTITTMDEELNRKLEPGAPSSRRRLTAMRELANHQVSVTLRLDPIIPFVNDAQFEDVIEAAAACGIEHVTSSTFKLRPDNWRRIRDAFPDAAARMGPLYFKHGGRYRNSWYLPIDLRRRLMTRAKATCDRLGLTFATCREGIPELMSGMSCDGSHLVRMPSSN